MIVRSDGNYEIHEDKPSGNWYENQSDNYVIDETTNEGKLLADKIKSNYPYYDLIVENGELTDVIPYNHISATTDKTQIIADGVDTATITATIDDVTSTETVELYHGETLADSASCVDGVATFQIIMTEIGTLTLTVKSTTKYGQNDITIEGV
jgi:hypothetical protein